MGQFAPHLFDDIKSEPDRVPEPALASYLKIAFQAIMSANRPMRAEEILALSKDLGTFPPHLYGETPEKTLNARLSEHIQKNGRSALFYRTGPATYFLTDLAEKYGQDERFKIFKGVKRSKSLKDERILVAHRDDLQKSVSGKFVPYRHELFKTVYDNVCFFENRYKAEDNQNWKQFVTFSVIKSQDRYLIYRRGNFTTTSNRLKGALSIGFGGHVADEDFTLFEDYGEALLVNSSREILEELSLSEDYQDLTDVSKHSEIKGFINVDTSLDARQHVACVILFDYQSDFQPGKNELSINGLSWFTRDDLLGSFNQFDHWSKIIIQKIDEMGL